jgi:hypothetical protein
MQPNKKFNQFALERKGGEFTPDAFQAFEKYLNPTLNNIYMTPSITRTRVLAKALAQENDRVGNNINQLKVQMVEWANHLSGKTNRIGDRQAADSAWMSKALKASEYVQRKVGQQSIVGNLATAVMQPVVLAQTAGKAGYKNTILGILQEFPGAPAHGKKAAINQSEFLRRRYLDTTPVTTGKVQAASNAAGTPLKVIEETAGRITWSSYYNQALQKGIKGKEAIRFADINAEKTMAGRAIGEKPELYRSKSAAAGTQFQLEVNNMWQQLGKEYSKADVARFVVAAYALNMGIQEIIGRQPAFNPLDAAIDTVAIMADEDNTPQEKAIKSGQRIGGEIVGNTPILPSILGAVVPDDTIKKVFGTETPVGRFGVGSTYGSFIDNTVGKVIKGKPLEAGAYLATPFGYSQANKTINGIKAVVSGEMTDKDGKTTVEVPQTPGNFVKGALFGPSAIDEVSQYYNNIGKKKEDQKPVKNQSNSVAAKQGNAIPLATGKQSYDEAVANTKKLYKGKYAGVTESELKELAKTDSQAKDYRNTLEATKKAFGAGADLPDTLKNETARKILDQASRTTNETWGTKKNTQKEVTDTLNSWLPKDVRKPQITNSTAKQWAEYERDTADGKLNALESETKKRNILTGAYKSELDDISQSFYKLGDDKMKAELERGTISKAQMDKIIETDNLLTSLGLQTYPQVGKKLRAALGYGQVASSSSSKSSSRSSSKKSGLTASELKLFGFGDPKSSSGKLRALLEQTQKSIS